MDQTPLQRAFEELRALIAAISYGAPKKDLLEELERLYRAMLLVEEVTDDDED